MAKYPHIPEKLYKYRDFSNPFHRKGLERDEQWFSSPNKFNDPLDTVASFRTERLPQQRQTLEEILAQIEEIKQTQAAGQKWVPPEITDPMSWDEMQKQIVAPLIDQLPEEQRKPMREFTKSWNSKVNNDLVNSMSAFFRSGFSVLSLSANPTSTLMWSHYAASHTGFCIEYDFGALPYTDLRNRMCFPVFYRNKRTDVSRYLAVRPRRRFNNLIGTYLSLIKSRDWEYEKEWRLVHPIGPDDANRAYPMPPPSALIVGASVSDGDLEYAQDFCAKRGIPLRQAQLSSHDTAISITDIPY
ncbi:DUF2971 domain-containing protein [Hyphomonas atlantica corrig.]|uniref:DUF2971 domain-containing protein n=1 Tax=Hyphomonas atlantica TaxID=1280948 RepID=UPI0023534B30|nr:DUF2971 domain-containing protein [Hyphomonas atlantica]